MRINNNVMALNAHRQYGINQASISKSTEKLSSGFRINRAGDDAAGLAISEKMRAQIRGLTMASKNSQDAISLVQTAEGALQETHNILQRMRELAVQAASDTNEQSVDRAALDQEFQQLKQEIDDIASKTRFNDQNLIDGTFSQYKFSAAAGTTAVSQILIGDAVQGSYTLTSSVRMVGAETGLKPTFSTNIANATNIKGITFTTGVLSEKNTVLFNKEFTLNFKEVDSTGIAHFTLTASDGTKFSGTASFSSTSNIGKMEIKFGGVGSIAISLTTPANISSTTASSQIAQICEGVAGMKIAGIGGKADVEGTAKAYLTLGEEEVEVFVGDKEIEFRSAGVIVVMADAFTEKGLFQFDNEGKLTMNAISGVGNSTVTVSQKMGQSMVIQTGANEGDNMSINVDRMDTKFLGIYTTGISTREKASEAITFVNNATNKVSTQRAALGALQNRLNHKIANLDTSAENLTAAESRIRDVDMAKEMTTFTKNNILFQASTAMLAQANAAPQGVLQLLG